MMAAQSQTPEQILLGYARASTHDQTTEGQRAALLAAGCRPEQLWTETASGYRDDRPELARLFAYARRGDVLVVTKLDRLGRSLRHLIEVVADLDRRGVGLCSLGESIDTTTPGGRLTFHLFGAPSSSGT